MINIRFLVYIFSIYTTTCLAGRLLVSIPRIDTLFLQHIRDKNISFSTQDEIVVYYDIFLNIHADSRDTSHNYITSYEYQHTFTYWTTYHGKHYTNVKATILAYSNFRNVIDYMRSNNYFWQPILSRYADESLDAFKYDVCILDARLDRITHPEHTQGLRRSELCNIRL